MLDRTASGSQALGELVSPGVATNVCVESTARDAFMRDYHVVLVEDCARATAKEEHEAACANISRYFGHVLDSRRVMALWAAASGQAARPR